MTAASARKGDTVHAIWRVILLKGLDYVCASYPGEVELRACYDQGLTPKEATDAISHESER